MGMENETREFLVLIVNTVAWVLLWMMVNVFVGIYHGFAFFEGAPDAYNLIFYVWFLTSLFLLVRFLKKKWGL
jgi:hypothetical protein